MDITCTYTRERGRQFASISRTGESWEYSYNADGLRTERTNGTVTYDYIYSGSQLIQMTVGTDTLYFTYDASGTPMAVDFNGTKYYYATNLQGDIIAILDSNGNAVVEYTYDAWGNILTATDSTLGNLNPLRYRGYVYDRETALCYLQSRYYDPELGRFINADALVSTGQGILGNNMYTYCLNNPVRYRDSLGVAAEEATDTDDSDNDEKDPGTRVVGAGIQFDLDVGMSTAGYEIILFWDPTVCGEGNWKVAVYNYNGICVSADDPFIQTVIACLMANAECFNLQDIENDCVDKATAFLQVVLASLSMDHSIGVSGVVVIGNSQFDGTEDYTEAFTSVNYSWDRFRGSYAYADTCRAITFGRNITGRSLLPSRSISQTYYYLQNEITFVAPF